MKFEHTEVFNFEGALRGMRNPLASWHKSDSNFNKNDYCISSDPEGNCTDCEYFQGFGFPCFKIGENDMNLALRLIAGGTEHRKFLRQIMVSVDITAPLYWWKEFDTYKVGTTANSTSTMHKLASTPITLDCFEIDDLERELPVGMWAMAGGEDYVAEPDYANPIQCGQMRVWDDKGNEEFFEHYYPECTREDFQYIDVLYSVINVCERLRQLYLETKDKRYWKELIRLLPNGWLQTRTVTMNYENIRSMYHQREHHKLVEWHAFCDWIKELPYAEEFLISKI